MTSNEFIDALREIADEYIADEDGYGYMDKVLDLLSDYDEGRPAWKTKNA